KKRKKKKAPFFIWPSNWMSFKLLKKKKNGSLTIWKYIYIYIYIYICAPSHLNIFLILIKH
ncbi:MAG: hypothetical protein N7Q72_03710, partial [Spiroplasma sp. Tabriz.8]|nr:hypothetical protein [Spiroplasma sp. Tabriz.8]